MVPTISTEHQSVYSTAISLLTLWTVRPPRSLIACKVELYLYSFIGRAACTYLQCLYRTPIHQQPLWGVGPVQSIKLITVQLNPYGTY